MFPKGVKAPLTLAQVTGIGGAYGVSCKQRMKMPEPLERPAPVFFVTIHEKHVDAEPSAGCFTAMSHTGAVLETEAPLERFANLQIDAGGKLFAKVMDRAGDGWLLRFTSIPPEFDAWRKTLV